MSRFTRALAWVLACVLAALLLFGAALYGLHREDNYRCQHGHTEAC